MSLKLFSRGIVRPVAQRPPDGKWPLIAFTLLEDLTSTDVDEVLIEAIYDQVSGGPHAKRTFPKRYGRIDSVILERLSGRKGPIKIHDMAASNGITSVELFELMSGVGTISVHATDYYDAVRIAAGGFGNWQVVFDIHDEPQQFIGRNCVISAIRNKYLVNRLIAATLNRLALPDARRRLENGEARRVALFHPAATDLARRDPRFTLGRDDLFSPAPDAYNLVRVMSAFAGFPEAQVHTGIERIGTTVVEGGYLVVGRNRGRHTEETPTSFFRREYDRFLLVQEIDGGSELNDLIKSAHIGAN